MPSFRFSLNPDDLVTYSWNEKCVSIGTEEFPWKWNSTDCDSTFYPVCKMSPSDSAVLIRPEDTGLHLIEVKLDFNSAEAECENRGGHLVSIHDEETRNRTVELCRPAVSAGACGCWIGLMVFENEANNKWTDDSPFGEYRDCNRSSCKIKQQNC
ncbi:hypothetical protein BaRGS_00033067 [Batillaria attramentaria]|uniref:C-type lectin domain-containing protein n=1 Tax=Batillaria attramentaria TaxID=370345 RepID=A0ABD0JM17_9CAEN